MATDIVDADLKALRNGRWDKAFKLGASVDHVDKNPRDEVNRKATIVIEHIIQASDISHTMQVSGGKMLPRWWWLRSLTIVCPPRCLS